MPILLGWIVGVGAGRVATSRIVMTFLMWIGLAVAGFRIGYANVSPAAGTVTAVLLPGLVLGWTLHRPAGSRTKMQLVEGLLLMAFVVQLWFAAKAALRLFGGGMLLQALHPLLVVAAMWGIRLALLAWVRRSDRLLGTASVLGRG